MRTYEAMLVLDPEMSKEQVDGVVERVRQFLDDRGGEVLKVEKWGSKTFAYEIKKETKGYYLLLYFKGNTELVSEMERSLRLMEEVLRYLTIKREGEDFETSHEEEESEEEREAAKEPTEEEPSIVAEET